MSAQQKKKSRRSQTTYPGLDKSVNRRLVREYMDQDYIDKLSDKEKEWLSNFNREWLSADFSAKKTLHKSKKKKREIYNRNNARNRDLVGILKQRGHVNNADEKTLIKITEDKQTSKHEKNHVEDAVIDILDFSMNQKKK